MGLRRARNTKQKVEFVTMNGDVIATFKREDFDGTRADTLLWRLEKIQDMVQDVPGARSDDLGVFVERFRLAIGDQIMHDKCCQRILPPRRTRRTGHPNHPNKTTGRSRNL